MRCIVKRIVLIISGLVIITILAFIIPNNPYKIIHGSMWFGDKPLWLCIMILGDFLPTPNNYSEFELGEIETIFGSAFCDLAKRTDYIILKALI